VAGGDCQAASSSLAVLTAVSRTSVRTNTTATVNGRSVNRISPILLLMSARSPARAEWVVYVRSEGEAGVRSLLSDHSHSFTRCSHVVDWAAALSVPLRAALTHRTTRSTMDPVYQLAPQSRQKPSSVFSAIVCNLSMSSRRRALISSLYIIFTRCNCERRRQTVFCCSFIPVVTNRMYSTQLAVYRPTTLHSTITAHLMMD